MGHSVILLAFLLCAATPAVRSAYPVHESSSSGGSREKQPGVHAVGVNRGSSQGTIEAPGPVGVGGGTRGGLIGAQNVGGNESTELSPDQYRDRIRNKNVRLFHIQRVITEELRFKHRPNLTGSLPLTPTQIEEIQAQFNQSERAASQRADATEDEYSSKKLFALRPACPVDRGVPQTWFGPSTPYRLYFPIDPPDESAHSRAKVSTAVLRLYRKPVITGSRRSRSREDSSARSPQSSETGRGLERSEGGTVTLTLYQYMDRVQPNVQGVKGIKRHVKTITLNPIRSGGGAISINLKGVVRDWYRSPRLNYGLEVELRDERGGRVDPHTLLGGYNCSASAALPLPATFISDDDEADGVSTIRLQDNGVTSPSLTIATVQIPRRKRVKKSEWVGGAVRSGRRPRALIDSSGTAHCTVKKEYVRFRDIGLSNLILKPQGFLYGACVESCPTCIQDENHTSCCRPTKRRALTLLIEGRQRLVLDDFIVTECGCE